jgi:hypothetical protein
VIPESDARERRAARLAAGLILGLTALRLGVAGFVGLGDVEAYYWTWAKEPALSYYDHPPMVAWLVALTTALGGDSPFFVRLGPILLFAATSALVYALGRDVGGSRRVGLRALVIFEVTPVFAVGGQGANPDVPLGFSWVAFLWILWHATTTDARRLALAAGAALGLAFLSKYFAALLALSALLWLGRREHRHWLGRWELYGAAALVLAALAPVVAWNVEWDWPSIRYHLGRHGGAGFDLAWAGTFLGGQALYYSPLLWGGLLWATARAWRRRAERPYAFVLTASLPALLFFTAVGLWTPEAEPHWTAMGYLPLCLAAAMLLAERWEAGGRALRAYVWIAAGLPAALIVLLHVHLLTPLFVPLVPERDRPRDLASETFGWDDVGRRAEALAARMQAPVLLHYHYTKCAQLSWAVRRRLPVACLNDRMDQFDFQGPGEKDLPGRDALYVTDSVYARRPEEVWRFGRCDEEAPLEIRRGGHLVRRFSFWRCSGYGGAAPGRRNL